MSRSAAAAGHRTAADWPRSDAGEYLVGGQPLSRVVAAAGGTPCYLYDRGRIAQRVEQVRRILPRRVKVHYAVKANPMPLLVGHLARLVDGLDVASASELRLALDSGMDAEHVSFAGPGKSAAQLHQAVAAGVLVNVESFRELDILAAASESAGRAARVAVRANLPFEMRGAGMRMAGGPGPFGIDAELVPSMLDAIAARQLAFEGFHLFWGSQCLRADAIAEAQERSYACVLEWTDAAGCAPRTINLGGGFGIPYTASDAPLDLEAVGFRLHALEERQRVELPGAQLVIELGRYLVGEAGLYVCRVVDRKESRGEIFLVVDGGMHQHLAASGNLGQVIRRNYPVGVNAGGAVVETASVVGPLCTPLDLLLQRGQLPAADVGSLVVVFQSGAYGRSASPTRFLGHPEPAEALV